MSLVPGVKNPAIDDLIQSSESENKSLRLEWIPCSKITDITSSPMDNVYYARHFGRDKIMLVFIGSISSEECTPTLVSEFARIYSLPTHKYNNDVSHFRRYSTWLTDRNGLIKGAYRVRWWLLHGC